MRRRDILRYPTVTASYMYGAQHRARALTPHVKTTNITPFKNSKLDPVVLAEFREGGAPTADHSSKPLYLFRLGDPRRVLPSPPSPAIFGCPSIMPTYHRPEVRRIRHLRSRATRAIVHDPRRDQVALLTPPASPGRSSGLLERKR